MLQLFHNPKIDFMGKRRLWVGVSLTLVAISLVILGVKGIHKGIEFEGGARGSAASTRRLPTSAPCATRWGRPGSRDRSSRRSASRRRTRSTSAFRWCPGRRTRTWRRAWWPRSRAPKAPKRSTVRSQAYIGPTVGKELVKKALGAVIGSMAGMLVYIWIRFEFQWGLAAVIALVHDTIITLGLFSLFGYEMSLPVVAAFLTLVGYSVNDTVVIFDRIRENLRAKGGTVASLPDLDQHVDESDALANDPDLAAHLDRLRVPVRAGRSRAAGLLVRHGRRHHRRDRTPRSTSRRRSSSCGRSGWARAKKGSTPRPPKAVAKKVRAGRSETSRTGPSPIIPLSGGLEAWCAASRRSWTGSRDTTPRPISISSGGRTSSRPASTALRCAARGEPYLVHPIEVAYVLADLRARHVEHRRRAPPRRRRGHADDDRDRRGVLRIRRARTSSRASRRSRSCSSRARSRKRPRTSAR